MSIKRLDCTHRNEAEHLSHVLKIAELAIRYDLTVLATADVGKVVVIFKGKRLCPSLHGVSLRGSHIPALIELTKKQATYTYVYVPCLALTRPKRQSLSATALIA